VWRTIRFLVLLIAAPFVTLIPLTALALGDLLGRVSLRRRAPLNRRPDTSGASIVIPNWNGRELLAAYLPSVLTAVAGNSQNEIIVVENGSTDGSAAFLREHFPQVRVIELSQNLGFGGGSNLGFREAKNEVVVLLNSDMRVAPDFLAPLLEGFSDERVFAVSCQIFFSDENRKREETGLTQAKWEHGHLRVRHVIDNRVTSPFPCFYGGGGSCAFDRRKFLELGGFDEVLRPFYLEDTDLGLLAWKRGWKCLYEPRSHVWHEHRGTIGKHFSPAHIQLVLQKNFLLFVWKNIHDWKWLAQHFFYVPVDILTTAWAGYSPERTSFRGLLRALAQLPELLRARRRTQQLAVVTDEEAFRRSTGGYFRDRFEAQTPPPEKLRVLFVSPYPVYPPIHGGGVFMWQTIQELSKICELHLIVLLDWEHELPAHAILHQLAKSVEFIVRMEPKRKLLGSALPHAVSEFRNDELEWLIGRQIQQQGIDVVQLEYTVLAQYAGAFDRIPCILFEHDIYFQSIARQLPGVSNPFQKLQWRWEYLRAIHYELSQLPHLHRVQVCSRENREYLESFLPALRGRIDDGFRAGIRVADYEPCFEGREPHTVLFLGSFRHLPNKEALDWFLAHCWDRVLEAEPEARLLLIGSDPPPAHSLHPNLRNVELIGFVPDVKEALGQCSVFICPILSGSGVRVKLLEGFAAGIPTVSTRVGAEGLAQEDRKVCHLADRPEEFAARVVEVLRDPRAASEMARRARQFVEQERDMRVLTGRLLESYWREVRQRRP
jgi:GT2 family glycosyltransferase/glycosyltransferase involved in cell wall biosynthesis